MVKRCNYPFNDEDIEYTVLEPEKIKVPLSRRLKIFLIGATKSIIALVVMLIIALVTILISSLIFACFYGGN